MLWSYIRGVFEFLLKVQDKTMEAQIINVVQVALFCPMTDKYTMAICVYLQGVMWGCFGAKWGRYQHNEGRSVCVCVFHCPLYNRPSGPYCFRLVLRPPVAADVILRSRNSSLIIVYCVHLCVLPFASSLCECVCTSVSSHIPFLSAWVGIFCMFSHLCVQFDYVQSRRTWVWSSEWSPWCVLGFGQGGYHHSMGLGWRVATGVILPTISALWFWHTHTLIYLLEAWLSSI